MLTLIKKLKDQNPVVIDRLVRSIQRKDLGLNASNFKAKQGLTFVKNLIEQYDFPHCFFTFSMAENKINNILNILRCC